MTPFGTSSAYVTTFKRVLIRRGLLEQVLAKCSPALRVAFDEPSAQRWWSSEATRDLPIVLDQIGGQALVRDVGRDVTAGSIIGLVKPLVSVVVALSGRSPTTIFSRFGEFASVSQRGITTTWVETSPNSGTLEATYPNTPPRQIVGLWFGPVEYALSVTQKKPVRIEGSMISPSTLRFELSWE